MNNKVALQFMKIFGADITRKMLERLEKMGDVAKRAGLEQKGKTSLLEHCQKALTFDELDRERALQHETARLEKLMSDFTALAQQRALAGNYDLSELVDQFTERVENPDIPTNLAELKQRYSRPVQKQAPTQDKSFAGAFFRSRRPGQNGFVQKMQEQNRKEMGLI